MLCAGWLGSGHDAAPGGSLGAAEFRVATFEADITIPIGHACMGGGVADAKEIVDPLFARGFVYLGAGERIVVAALDWCQCNNDSYDRWRDVLARAAGTKLERVMLSTVHQHDAPICDLTAQRLLDEHGLVPDDVIIDVSISALAADTTGMTRAALEAVERIASDPQLAGVHLCGGLSNIAQQLPATTRSGLPLREGLENAFLTQAIPRGLDMIIGTPWRDYRLLPADDPVYAAFSEIVALDGRDALRRLLQLQRS